MVRVGSFELRLVTASGGAPPVPLPEVAHKGVTYAVAAPGQSFEVQVSLHHPAPQLPYGVFHNASLKVDGQCVGYSKNMVEPSIHNFDGFLLNGDAQGCAMQAFVFAKPQETEAKQAHNLNFVEGTIKEEVYHCQLTGEENHMRRVGPATANDSIAKLPEGKKFFLAPSLTTGKGELKMCSGLSKRAQTRLPGGPVATLELRYETAATLLLRGVLNRDDPLHRAILQQFPETAPKEEPRDAGREQDENAAGPANAARQAAGGRGGRKRLRDQDTVIDLTKAPAVGDEVLAAKAQDKLLECDLTGDDVPAWRSVKKQVYRV